MEENRIIRRLHGQDLDAVMQIWLEANAQAHAFIPRSYWEAQLDDVKEMIPVADVYVCENSKEIIGFVGLVGNYIAGIFVAPASQSQGIGKRLLDHVKSIQSGLHLNVYQKNNRAVQFYLRENFTIQSEGRDENTGENDFLMVWGTDQ